jgi:hypothetical protein
MHIHQAQGAYTEDNFKSIYFPSLLKAAGFLLTAFFLPLHQIFKNENKGISQLKNK